MISYGKQYIDDEDISAVISVLQSDFLTQGPSILTFEQELCSVTGANFCTAVSNGTAALHLAGLALGWKQGDIILSTPITFLSSINAIVFCGATPDFVDIHPENYTIDVEKLRSKIESYRNHNQYIKAVVAVDYAGNPCDWEVLYQLSREYDFQLVADACHSLGASYNNDTSYTARYADITTLSFHPVKHITTGEGGAILTNNEELHSKVQLLRTHGMTKNPDMLIQNDGPWYYEMIDLGYNYRLTDFQAALGTSQLKKLAGFIQKRKDLAKNYTDAFSHLHGTLLQSNEEVSNSLLQLPIEQHSIQSAFHLYPILINFDKIAISKIDFFQNMFSNGIRLQVHYIPVHLQPYYKNNFGFKQGDFPIAERFYELEFSLPLYPSLKFSEQDSVIHSLNKLLIQ